MSGAVSSTLRVRSESSGSPGVVWFHQIGSPSEHVSDREVLSCIRSRLGAPKEPVHSRDGSMRSSSEAIPKRLRSSGESRWDRKCQVSGFSRPSRAQCPPDSTHRNRRLAPNAIAVVGAETQFFRTISFISVTTVPAFSGHVLGVPFRHRFGRPRVETSAIAESGDGAWILKESEIRYGRF